MTYPAVQVVGALPSLRAGEAVDTVECRRPRRVIKRELRAAAEPYRHSVLGEEAISTAIGRCVNDLLGPRAETVGEHLQAVEEVLRHRGRGGPALWLHAIDEWADRSAQPADAVAALRDTAARVARAEVELRTAGILGPEEIVPTVLGFHWGNGVHLARGAMEVGWLDRTRGLDFLRRAGELAQRWYASPSVLVAAQLLPSALSGDADTIHWASLTMPPLLATWTSPHRSIR